MKIVFIVDDYSGGAGNIVQLLSTEYAKHNDVFVLLSHQSSEKRYECKNVVFLEMHANNKPKNKIKSVLYQIKWVKNKIISINPDIVISFLTGNNILAGLSLIGLDIPFVVCERICPTDIRLNGVWKRVMRFSYNRANAITVQFSAFKTLYGDRYEEKCFVTPNYIMDPQCVKEYLNDNGKIRFISCGRLNESKQFEKMIEMFDVIHKNRQNTELYIFGKGPYEDRLIKLINELNLQDVVYIKGYSTDIYNELCEADIYLMSSKSEGFPNALSEAMAVGLASVAFRCNPGIDELCDGGRRGIVVPLNDTAAFINSAILLCDQKQLRKELGNKSKEVINQYSMESVKSNWDFCIAEAIRRKRKK